MIQGEEEEEVKALVVGRRGHFKCAKSQKLPFQYLYSEPTKDEYSIMSLPFIEVIDVPMDTFQESDFEKELQEKVDRLRERVTLDTSGEYNAIFGKVVTEKYKRNEYSIIVSYTLYHLNNPK